MLDRGHPLLRLRRQCAVLGRHRSSLDDVSVQERAEHRWLMRLSDAQDTRPPLYGSRRMTAWLRGAGDAVTRKRVVRLLGESGLEAIFPRPRRSAPGPAAQVSPYVRHGMEMHGPNQVWGTAITSMPRQQGCMSRVVIMDWDRRVVLSWELSNPVDVGCCLVALEEARAVGKPHLFNRAQGVQCTSHAFTGRLEEAGVAISMDGRGRVVDHIFVERLWRTVQYADINLKAYGTVPELDVGREHSWWFDHHARPPQALRYQTPAQVSLGELAGSSRQEAGESQSPFA
jgi:putative transposase